MIKVCDNEEEIRSIVIDDQEMLERVSFDGFKSENVEMLSRGVWLSWVNDKGVTESLCCFKAISPFVIDIHIHTPEKFRGKGTLSKGKDFLGWIISRNKGRFLKFETSIPAIHRDVILYAMKLGFKREGTSRKSVIKNGVLMDVANMGITFEEVLNGRI